MTQTEIKLLSVVKFNLELSEDCQPKDILRNNTISAKDWLLERYHSQHNFGVDDLLRNSFYRHMGFRFNFAMPCYLYRLAETGQWFQGYAPSKAALRLAVGARISRIITLTDDLK